MILKDRTHLGCNELLSALNTYFPDISAIHVSDTLDKLDIPVITSSRLITINDFYKMVDYIKKSGEYNSYYGNTVYLDKHPLKD